MKKLFTLTVLTAVAISVFSQPPQKMSYQAVIRNSSGQLVSNHAVGMRISILQGSATGTAVNVETHMLPDWLHGRLPYTGYIFLIVELPQMTETCLK